jgi:hypothetical protein
LDSTPDGKEGWHSYAVRHNLASFVMDQPGRGRSGFDQSVLHEAKATRNWDMVPTFGRVTDNGAWTQWFGHIIAGSTIMDGKMIRHGDPGDPDPAENARPSPAHGNYSPKFPIPPSPDSADPTMALPRRPPRAPTIGGRVERRPHTVCARLRSGAQPPIGST